MKKKIDLGKQFAEEHLHLFQCPICQGEFLEAEGNCFVCVKNHSFDFSKKGTLHLLLKGGQNDYGRDMLLSRRKLAATGFFHPLLDQAAKHLNLQEKAAVLDVGCGEGSHLHYLAQKGLSGVKIGFDISKDAIQLAAGDFFEDAFWCVADLAASPFAAGQFSAILNVFSPSHYQEFERLLRPGGKVIKVVPDSAYLAELRQKLYAADERKQNYENEKVVERFKEHYPDCIVEKVSYRVPLTPESFNWLLEMTPLSWGAEPETVQAARKDPLPFVTVAASILVGENQEGETAP